MKFAHLDIIGSDWRAVSQLFGCVPVPLERKLSGPWFDAATGVPGTTIVQTVAQQPRTCVRSAQPVAHPIANHGAAGLPLPDAVL